MNEMTDTSLFAAGVGALALVALTAIMAGPWRSLWTDVARQALFTARDSLFLMAADGKLDFQSSEYREVRSLLNGMIRLCHSWTLSRLLLTIIMVPVPATTDESSMGAAVDRIEDPRVRREVEGIIDDAMTSVMAALAMKSILTVFMLAPIYVIGFAFQNGRSRREKAKLNMAMVQDADRSRRVAVRPVPAAA